MSSEPLKSSREREPVITSALDNEVGEIRSHGAGDIHSRLTLSRRQLIALFVLVNFIGWLLVVWLVAR
jgi:hypothetical protein